MAMKMPRRRSVMARGKRAQGGMTLIELMIAMLVLAVGLTGLLGLILSAISSNTRNRNDTTATFLAQMVMEQIIAQPASQSPTLSITDCAGTASSINTTGVTGTVGSGATLYTSGTAPTAALVNTIDFTQASSSVPAGYRMQYVVCYSTGIRSTYDIRWNIIQLSNQTKVVTVSARQLGSTSSNIKLFAPPVTLRTIAGT
jgi:type IV pilus modification protein PilV